MKRILLSLAAFVMIIASANAQETSFGVKAGVNLANVGGDAEGDMRIGYHLGGVANFGFTDKIALAPELLLSLQGSKDDFAGETVNLNLLYVNIPVLLKYYIVEGLNVHAGPYVGVLLAAKYKSDDDDEDAKDEMNTVDFGLSLGAGYELDNGLNFGARYNAGLSNIADVPSGSDYKMSNQVIQLFVGFNF